MASVSFGGFDFNARAIRELTESDETSRQLTEEAIKVRNRARRNANVISPRLSQSIEAETGKDSEGPYADVGYNKSAPGFVLWWHEVGTVDFPATPHLRPALRPGNS